MRIMTEKRFRHLPVVDASGVIGVLSIGDLVRAVLEEQQRRSQSSSSTSTASGRRRAHGAPAQARYLRQNVGVNSTAKVMISMRPRNIAAMQIQLWKSFSAP